VDVESRSGQGKSVFDVDEQGCLKVLQRRVVARLCM
jgi:hypothetical protein